MSTSPAVALASPTAADLLATNPFSETRHVAEWIAASDDNRALPYIVIDKINAQLFLFDGDGSLRATTPVLLGAARGDDSPAGIGTKKLAAIRPGERITPAGRFESVPGEDMDGSKIIWIDYGAAIALHRASDRKPGMSGQSRAERLTGTTSAAKRVSLGCINVSTAFYDRYIAPSLGGSASVTYIMPETRSATVQFRIDRAV